MTSLIPTVISYLPVAFKPVEEYHISILSKTLVFVQKVLQQQSVSKQEVDTFSKNVWQSISKSVDRAVKENVDHFHNNIQSLINQSALSMEEVVCYGCNHLLNLFLEK